MLLLQDVCGYIAKFVIACRCSNTIERLLHQYNISSASALKGMISLVFIFASSEICKPHCHDHLSTCHHSTATYSLSYVNSIQVWRFKDPTRVYKS